MPAALPRRAATIARSSARHFEFQKETNPMRKLLMILTVAISFLGITGAANAGGPPPSCGDNCPFVR
jgi:hypothetical protein